MDLDLARSVAPYFRVAIPDANEIIDRCKTTVAQWPKIAARLDLSAREQERMAPAFELAG